MKEGIVMVKLPKDSKKEQIKLKRRDLCIKEDKIT